MFIFLKPSVIEWKDVWSSYIYEFFFMEIFVYQ